MRNKKSIIIIIIVLAFTGASTIISCTHPSQGRATSVVSFSKDIIPIFTASCALNSSCHLGANGTNQDIDLDSSAAYNCIIVKGLVSISNPSSSLLYVEVEGNGIAEMPKPPAPALPTSQQNLILEWIKQGALNN